LIVIVVANDCAFTQDVGTPAAPAPRILIELPDNVPSDAVWIRYFLSGPRSSAAIVEREPNLRQYVIDARIGVEPAQHAKIAVYVPGCQFKAYTIDLDGASDASEHFQCDSLPNKTVHGFLPPAQIPSTMFSAEKTLAISNLTGYVISFFKSDEVQPSSGLARAWVRVFLWAELATSILRMKVPSRL
jgi:hypothetical protein